MPRRGFKNEEVFPREHIVMTRTARQDRVDTQRQESAKETGGAEEYRPWKALRLAATKSNGVFLEGI